jgi:hypothetical protein
VINCRRRTRKNTYRCADGNDKSVASTSQNVDQLPAETFARYVVVVHIISVGDAAESRLPGRLVNTIAATSSVVRDPAVVASRTTIATALPVGRRRNRTALAAREGEVLLRRSLFATLFRPVPNECWRRGDDDAACDRLLRCTSVALCSFALPVTLSSVFSRYSRRAMARRRIVCVEDA